MGRKVFQDFVNVICSWTGQSFGEYEDLQLLSRRHDGILTIDLLTSDSLIDGESVPPLRFAGMCADWLDAQLNSRRISHALISRAELSVSFVVELTGKDDNRCLRAHCQFTSRCVIATPVREYCSEHTCAPVWGYIDPRARPGVDAAWER